MVFFSIGGKAEGTGEGIYSAQMRQSLAEKVARSEQLLLATPNRTAPEVLASINTSKDGRTEQTFDVLDWLARLVVRIQDRHEQLAGYVGYCSNKSRSTSICGTREITTRPPKTTRISPNS